MTCSTPTAAKSASPPPRGGGLGVGGHLRPTCSGLLLALLLSTPATAQIIPTGTPAADILLSQAITEQRVFHTCSAFDVQTHQSILDLWASDAAFAAEVLAGNNVPPEAIAAFTAAAAPRALLPAPETPFEDVKQFCDTHPAWQTRLAQFDFVILANDLPKAFE
jgi:hypothetical protein